MDIDDDGTQRAAVADNFGVEPDFEELDEEAKEVSNFCDGCQDETNV